MTSRHGALALAALGTAISSYLVWLHYSGALALCVGVGGCELVQTSRQSMIGPIPVAAVGLAGFASMLAAAAWRLRSDDEAPFVALFALSLGATAFVTYLTYVEVMVLGALCPWCVSVALCAVGIFALSAREVMTA